MCIRDRVGVDGPTCAPVFPSGVINAQADKMYIQWQRDSVTNELFLQVMSSKAYSSTSSNARLSFSIRLERIQEVLIFETEPQDTLPDVFYEADSSYSIDSSGLHSGNVQDQTATLPAIINTSFFNCYAFGNGAESYKVRDSIIGKTIDLGNRTLTTSAQDFKEADRFAAITYSGVFNTETNVNKLNEFNLGLLNFKNLEESFGAIQILLSLIHSSEPTRPY